VITENLARRVLQGCVALALLLFSSVAFAQTSGAGVLTGVVVDATDKKPVADVVVTVTSPALQGEQVVVTDSSGFYRIPGLPAGDYTLRLEKESFRPYARGGIAVRGDSTLRANAQLLPESLKAEEVVVVAKSPTVDVGSSSTGSSITKDFTRRVPVAAPGGKGSASRSFEAVAATTPGAKSDAFGVSVNGASSPENSYVIDGLSVNNPGTGVIGTPLSMEFVDELNVISGGYMPEYGRSTGGTLSATTKSGSNEFHGGIFGYYSPGVLEGRRKLARPAVGTVIGGPSLSYIGDIGADLGGPIVRDKLWFYMGVDFSQEVYNIDRAFYATADSGAQQLIPGTQQHWDARAQQLQALGKLTWAVNPDNKLTLAANMTPTWSGGRNLFAVDPRSGGAEGDPRTGGQGYAGTFGSLAHQMLGTAYDASLKWSSEFNNKRLLLDTQIGWHHERDGELPADGTLPGSGQGLSAINQTTWDRNSPGFHPITDFETFGRSDLCDAPGTLSATRCPVPEYFSGGPGNISVQVFNRYGGGSTLTYLFQGFGHHVAKAGFNVELTTFDHLKGHSGGANYIEDASSGDIGISEGYGQLIGPDQPSLLDPLRIKTKSLNAGGFVQDSWSIADRVTLNAGVRYDVQQLYSGSGTLGLSLPNQWAPRVGVVWDPTQEGRAKVFGNYARYYENVPLAVNDLTLTGEPSVLSTYHPSSCVPGAPPYPAGIHCTGPANVNDASSPSRKYSSFGAGSTPIDPDIEATSSDELVFGGEYELFKDSRLGASYTKRWLNRWIEDFSRDGLQTFVLGNPGYGIATDFPKTQRDYDALTLYYMKRFSDEWLMQASWTISYLRGNIGGLFKASNNELDPNHNADYDKKDFTINQNGPLPGDHTHDIKVFVAKDWQLLAHHTVSTGTGLHAQSGLPINYYANDDNYGEGINLLLPRGSGGRTPWTYGADLNLAYRYNIDKDKSIAFTVDIFNLFNFQETTRVDENYTSTNAVGRQNGTLRDARTQDAPSRPLNTGDLNPNFKTALGFQEPRVFRFGLRSTF
jgi:hypothetical protein